MNKTLIIIFGLVLLIGVVVAVDTNKGVKVNIKTSNVINDINNQSIERGNITCDELTCSQKMWKGDYNLGEVTTDRYKCNEWSEPTTKDYVTEIKQNITYEEIDNETVEIVKNYTTETLNPEWTSVCLSEVEIKEDKIIEEITKLQQKRLEEIAKVITKRTEKAEENNLNKKIIEDTGSIILTN